MWPKILKFLSNFFQYQEFLHTWPFKRLGKTKKPQQQQYEKQQQQFKRALTGSSDPKSQHWNNQNTNPTRKIEKFLILTCSISMLVWFMWITWVWAGGDCGVARSLNPCSKGSGFETRHVTKCEVRISKLSVMPSKKAKVFTRCGHIERKDQGHTAQLVFLFTVSFVLCW